MVKGMGRAREMDPTPKSSQGVPSIPSTARRRSLKQSVRAQDGGAMAPQPTMQLLSPQEKGRFGKTTGLRLWSILDSRRNGKLVFTIIILCGMFKVFFFSGTFTYPRVLSSETYSPFNSTLVEPNVDAGTNINATVNPCSTQYWISELANDNEMLQDLSVDDLEMIHITFEINGMKNMPADDRKMKEHGRHDRTVEKNFSVSCLKKTLPDIRYREIQLGDFSSYQDGLSVQHSWLSSGSNQVHQGGGETARGTFVIDTDVYANPNSSLSAIALTRALKNVDMAFVYNPNRGKHISNERVDLQAGGLQAGLMGHRHNKRTRLFHMCVAETLRKTNYSIRQQRAINQVLESPLGQFVRVRWLPPEFHCFSSLEHPSDFVVNNGPNVHEDPCYFIHSHRLAKKGGLYDLC